MKKFAILLSVIFFLLPLAISCTPPPLTKKEKAQLIKELEKDSNYKEIIPTHFSLTYTYTYTYFYEQGEVDLSFWFDKCIMIAKANGIGEAIKRGEQFKVKVPSIKNPYSHCIVEIVSLLDGTVYLDFEIGKQILIEDINESVVYW